MDPDDAMDVKRGDEAIDQGLAYQLEQCRYALLQRDEQLRKALAEVAQLWGDRDHFDRQHRTILQEKNKLQEKVQSVNWELSDHVDAGGGIDALIAWAKSCKADSAKLQAQCAAMREALLSVYDKDYPPRFPKVAEALASTAGQDLLAQLTKLQAELQEAVELLLKSSPRDFSDAAARLQWVQQRDAFIGRQKGGTA